MEEVNGDNDVVTEEEGEEEIRRANKWKDRKRQGLARGEEWRDLKGKENHITYHNHHHHQHEHEHQA